MAKSDSASCEYLDVSENVRHEANTFFANATVFSTITGALLAFLYYKDPSPTPRQELAVSFAGILTAGCFWIAAEVYLYRGHYFMKRAADLEVKLGYHQYSGMLERKRRFRPGSWGWRVLFGSVLGFWMFSTLSHLGLSAEKAIGVAVVAVIVIQVAILLGSRTRSTRT